MLLTKIESFAAGDRIDGFFLIKAYNLKTSSNNKKYLDMTLVDRTGEVNAKYWDISDVDQDLYEAGIIIKVRGDVTLWQNSLQLKILKMRPVEAADRLKVEDFVPSAPIPAEEMYEELMQRIESMRHKDIKNITKHLFTVNKEELLYYPAAKSNHHAVRSGLLYHLLRMARTAEKLCEVYPVNRDLLMAGVLLHDMEKLNEMTANHLGIVQEYSQKGQLLGHIVQGIVTIEQVGKEVGASMEIIEMIQHMILSHHYYPEFGSPKKPLFPEAELLHHIDMIDARMYDMFNEYRSLTQGSFSEPVFSLDRRRIYKSSLHE